MKSASGLIFMDGEFVRGSAEFRRGKVVLSKETDPDADISGIILPKTVNCHTHLGDGFIRLDKKYSVAELVAPPDGLKHRMLRSVREQEQTESMRANISLMASTGTSHFIDFRESGLEGTRRLLMATLGNDIMPVILGRPESGDVSEVSALLSVADGIGLSAVSDVAPDVLAGLSGHARSSDKIFGIHASETVREDIDSILSLKPDLLVHMIQATQSDLEACASAGVPIAICPGSNSYFGLKPPLRKMLDTGITVCLGTDNAMLSEPNMLSEMGKLRRMFPDSEISDSEILQITFMNGGKVLNSLPGLGDVNSNRPDFFVLEAPADDPFGALLGAEPGQIHMFTTGGIP